MTTPPPPHSADDAESSAAPGDELRLAEALERWFDARESGQPVSVEDVANGDRLLESRLRELIDHEPTTWKAKDGERHSTFSPAEPFPEKLGAYRILTLIGQGAMGRVFLAKDETLGRLVAVKVVRVSDDDARSSDRFDREAKIMARIDHPNIVPIYAYGREGDRLWIAMKWLSGSSLHELTAPLSPDESARIGLGIARALAAAHAAGVVHRDIKPSNILLDDGHPFIADFGLARHQSDATLTRQGVVPGTLAYIAPECLKTGVSADPRVDIYALGATLYEVMTGRRPFNSDSDAALLAEILFRDPDPLLLDRRFRDIETIILRCLDKEPQRRFPTASDLADEFARYLDGRPINSRRSGWAERAIRAVRRYPRTSIAVATAAIIAIASLGWMIDRRRTDAIAVEKETLLLRRLIDEGDLSTARSHSASALQRSPENAELVRIDREIQSLVTLERLLRRIEDRPECVPVDGLQADIDAVIASAAREFRPGTTACSLALGLYYLDRIRDAQRVLDAVADTLQKSRAAAIIRGVLGKVHVAATDLPSGNGVDDLVLSAIAMRCGDYALETRAAEIERAYALEPSNYHVLYARGSIALQRGRFVEARATFESMRRVGLIDSGVDRQLAYLDYVDGNLDGSRTILARIPATERTSFDAVLEILVFQRSPGPEFAGDDRKISQEVLARAEAALKDRSDDAAVLSLIGRTQFSLGMSEAGRKTLSIVAETAKTPFERDRAAVYILTDQLRIQVPRPFQRTSRDPAADRKLLDDAIELAKRTNDPTTKAHAFWIASRVAHAAVSPEAAAGYRRSAIEASIELRMSIVDEIWLTADRLRRWTKAIDGPESFAGIDQDLRTSAEYAHSLGKQLLESCRRGMMPLPESQIATTEYAMCIISVARNDKALCAELAPRVLKKFSGADDNSSAMRAVAERCLSWADSTKE